MPCGIILVFSASYMIRRCWFYYCLHVVKAHPLPIVFKTVFIRMGNVRHLTSKLCTVCTTTRSSPQHSTADRQQFLCHSFHTYTQGPSIFWRKGARIMQEIFVLDRWSISSDPVFHLFSQVNSRFFNRKTVSESSSVHSLVEPDQLPQLSFLALHQHVYNAFQS